MTDIAYGWVCSDCAMLIANGETPPELSEDETAAWLETIVDRTRGYHVALGGEHECSDPDSGYCSCETQEFSWQGCDNCGSGLGGARHAAGYWPA